jgi:hypothetical protein
MDLEMCQEGIQTTKVYYSKQIKEEKNDKATFPKNTATPPERELPQGQKPYNTRTKKRSFDDM